MIIVIEGGDQAGKKTQSALLQKALEKNKIKTQTFSFPDYTTPIGRQIKRYLTGRQKLPPQLIHTMLAANRWEKLFEIQKAHEKNSVLIMNRYYQSNLVYGMAGGLKSAWLEGLDQGMPKADLVILLDVTHAESFDRKRLKRDRFEKNREFLKKVTSMYRKTAKKQRWKVVDASRPRQEIHSDIMKIFAKKVGI